MAEAMRDILPTPTFAGLRAAQVDLGIEPTSAPHRHEIMKRLNGDPAICGWVEGNSSMYQRKTCPVIQSGDQTNLKQTIPSPVTLDTLVRPQHRS